MIRLLSMSLLTCLSLGCSQLAADATKAIQGKATALKEADLPKCSKVLTCCAHPDTASLTQVACGKITVPVDAVIAKYTASKKDIQANVQLTAAQKTTALADLKVATQDTMEPGCRCLLEDTVGKVSAAGVPTPLDCQTVTTTGALPQGKTCADVTSLVTGP